jgi:hypothetical protein
MSRGARAGIAILVVFLLQYLAISNTGAGVYSPAGSARPYSLEHSFLPLPSSVNRALLPGYQVLKWPLDNVMRRLTTMQAGHRAFRVLALLTPFGNDSSLAIKANHVVLAAVNLTTWCLAGSLVFVGFRISRREKNTTTVDAHGTGA